MLRLDVLLQCLELRSIYETKNWKGRRLDNVNLPHPELGYISE